MSATTLQLPRRFWRPPCHVHILGGSNPERQSLVSLFRLFVDKVSTNSSLKSTKRTALSSLSADDGLLVLLGRGSSTGQLRDCITQLRRVRLEAKWRGRILICLDKPYCRQAAADDLIILGEGGGYGTHRILARPLMFAQLVKQFYTFRPFEDDGAFESFLKRFEERDTFRLARRLFNQVTKETASTVAVGTAGQRLFALLKMWTNKNNILNVWLGHDDYARILSANATLQDREVMRLPNSEIERLLEALSVKMDLIPQI